MKKIAIISNTSWSLYNFRKALIKSLQEKGHVVTCIAPFDDFSEKLEIEFGCKFIELKKLNAKGLNILEDLKLIFEFKNILKKNNFDYVFSYTAKPNIYGNLGGILSKTKFINTVNGLGSGLAEDTLISKLMRFIYKMSFLNSSKIIFQNEDDRSYFIEYKIIKLQKSKVVNGSGIDIKEFPKVEKFNTESEKLTFLLSARLVKEKGIVEYIEASKLIKKKYPNVHFQMCGIIADNPSSISLEELEKLNALKTVEFLGAHHNMKELLKNIDVLVLPSYYREGIPRILLEGLSMGLPLITTNSVGCKETVIDGENGYKIEARSIDSLVYACEKMILLPFENRKRMSEKSRFMAESKFDVQIVNLTYLELVQ